MVPLQGWLTAACASPGLPPSRWAKRPTLPDMMVLACGCRLEAWRMFGKGRE